MIDDNELHLLLVDDDEEFIADFKRLLPRDISVYGAATTDAADQIMLSRQIDALFLDIDLGRGGDGLDYLKVVRAEYPYLPVIMITADREIGTVVRAMREGACDYVGKSPNLDNLKISIEQAISRNLLLRKYDLLAEEYNRRIGQLVGGSPAMSRVKAEIEKLAAVRSAVLITGPSGTGKELAARRIHDLSRRSLEPFVAVNCAALTRELVESELFGHEKGAFTGATGRQLGKFELVGSGTLFLDEITEIAVEVQAKLLRVLQEKEFGRIGGSNVLKFRGRILASTNRDIKQALKDGVLREDLYFRLNVARLEMPPLNKHREDIAELVDYFVKVKSAEMKRPPLPVTHEALTMLNAYHWPGNVRELENCIENALVHATSEMLDTDDFERIIDAPGGPSDYEAAKRSMLLEFQRDYISAALKKNNSNVSATARELGISRQGLIKMMKACGISD